jgi:hypothetical protein
LHKLSCVHAFLRCASLEQLLKLLELVHLTLESFYTYTSASLLPSVPSLAHDVTLPTQDLLLTNAPI